MSGAPDVRLRRAYAAALRAHVADPGETTLHAAYEVGREAVADGVSVLELAAAHHDVLLQELGRSSADGATRVTEAAKGFLLEALATYEMVRRGYHEAAFEAAVERRHAQAIRRLSTLLADASLASDREDPLAEILQLIAEAATELVDAGASVVAARSPVAGAWTAAWTPPDAGLPADVRPRHLLAVHVLLQAEARPVRLSAADLAAHPAITLPAGARPAAGWLAAPVHGLDGLLIGSVEVFDWLRGPPTELDEALVVHLAQMAAAAIDRTALYRG